MSEQDPQTTPPSVPPPPPPTAPQGTPPPAPPNATTPPPAPTSNSGNTITVQPLSKEDESLWAMLSHISAFFGFLIPSIGHLLGPAVVYFMQKDRSKFVRFHAVQSVAFQLAFTVIAMILAIPIWLLIIVTGGLAAFVVIPISLLLLLAFIGYIIYMGLQAQKGEFNKYPIVGEYCYKRVWEQDWKPL